ncbi:hypothetical protein [Agrobacterium rosae]
MTKTVMATQAGTYGHYREYGDVFELTDDKHFSKVWMTEVSSSEAKALQKAAQTLPEADRHVVDTTVVDNAELEGLRAQILEKDAEIERLKRNKPASSAKSEGDKSENNEQGKTPAEVLAMASDPTVEFMTFKAAARKLLGDKTPSTKAEMIAALEDLATAP